VCGQDGGGSTAMKFFSPPLLFFLLALGIRAMPLKI